MWCFLRYGCSTSNINLAFYGNERVGQLGVILLIYMGQEDRNQNVDRDGSGRALVRG